MKTFLRNWRKDNLSDIRKYFIYALGEILLIIIGILIAVSINEWQNLKKDNILRCQYLEELRFSIAQDIEDVKGNIGLFEKRNPKIKEVLEAIDQQKLSEVDSVFDKIDALKRYVFFVQQSKSKIEELKYSSVNLITNRSLKNRILLYQESKVMPLLRIEKRFFKVHDKVDDYFDSKFNEIDLKELQDDKHFILVASQKLKVSQVMKKNYEFLLHELNEIEALISQELNEKCSTQLKE